LDETSNLDLLWSRRTLLTMLAIVMTGSRGGLLAMVLVFVLSLYLCSRLPGGRQRVLKILVSMAGATALAAFLP
jgi:hypothetical protein